MYLTAVDLSWEGECSHSDPDREEEETRDSGMIFFLSHLVGPGSSPLPRNVQGQGMGANMTHFWEHRQTQPWHRASTPGQMDRKTDDRYRDEDTGSD